MNDIANATIDETITDNQHIIFVTCIEYGLGLRDQKYAQGTESLADIRERLPKVLTISCPDYIVEEVTEVQLGEDNQQLNDYLYDDISDKLGWLVDSAIITIPSLDYRVFHTFRSTHNLHTWTDQFWRGEISKEKMLQLASAFETEWTESRPASALIIERLRS
jgi:hypothetical protein